VQKVLNRGVSFGLVVPVVLVYLAIGLVSYLIVKEERFGSKLALGLILMGGVMNLVSRLKYGGVYDNLVLAGMLRNNIADYLIVVGVVVYGWYVIVARK